MSNEPLCVGKFQTTRHGALTVVTCGKPKHDRVHNTEGPFPPGPPPCPGINLHDFREFPPEHDGNAVSGHSRNETPTEQCMHNYDGDGKCAFCGYERGSEAYAELSTLRSTVAKLTAEREPREVNDEMGKRTVRWGLDDPALDGTDAAHPAWWRGNDDGVRAVVKIVTGLLDGVPHVGTFGNTDLELVAKRIALLVAAKDAAIGSRDLTIRALTLQLQEARRGIPMTTPTNAPESAGGETRKRDIARTIASAIAGLLHNDEDCDPRHDCVHWPKHDAEILIFETLDAYDESASTPAAPQPETEGSSDHYHLMLGEGAFLCPDGNTCPDVLRPAPQPETEGMTFEAMPKFRNVGNGRCLYCDDVGNLHRRLDQPDGHMVCYDCSRAYRIGWTAAKKGGR